MSKPGAVALSPLSIPDSIPPFDELYGALLIGTFITLMLYGLTVHQTYRYVCLYPSDVLVLKFIAFGLFIMQKSFTQTWYIFRFLNSAGYGSAILVDVTLTGALVAILRSRHTALQRTNNLLDSLALYAVVATVLTTISTVPISVMTLMMPHNFIWIAMTMPATKVYSNSVLAM
ncbi:hypothetical protein C8Q74DRAFT_1363620 [Fomes fomentarius]|nr:hypothetical protein C8Q74DRAFT_1363620 [Fomes fomentarius]